jgi:cation:H+ antiporter
MLTYFALLAVGLLILYYGAETMVRGATSVASIMGISPMMIGLTVVAFGTSAPELVACLLAVYKGSGDIALGNIIGSNIANVGLVMGAAAIISPIVIHHIEEKSEVPVMLGLTALFLIMAIDGELSRIDGLILFVCLLGFLGFRMQKVRQQKAKTAAMENKVDQIIDREHGLKFEMGLTVVGIIGVMIGAYLLIESASSIARGFGVSELIIGVTIVAIGTSLPELATTLVAASRGHSDLAFGNVIGSNIFNIGLILGLTTMAVPLKSDLSSIYVEMGVMALMSVALAPIAWRRKMGRAVGVSLLLFYTLFIFWIVLIKMAG